MAFRQTILKVDGYEQVVEAQDPVCGLHAIIAVHSTRLGPSCGGIRLVPYVSREEALNDVLRLSKGMSYKSAVAGLGFGGGKSVIMADPKSKSPELFRAFGNFVESLQGRYIAAKDMNVESSDLLEVRKNTRHVLGIEGLCGSGGDPSPITAIGCFEALKAVVQFVNKSPALSGMRIAIQGLGHVGYLLAKMVVASGGRIIVSDINPSVLKKAQHELGAEICANEKIYDIECDVFSPCAKGAVLNTNTVSRLKCLAIVGCANNQLADPTAGLRLWERGILYAPDYVVNAGGIINIFVEHGGYDRNAAIAQARRIFQTITNIMNLSKKKHTPAFLIADQIAEERLYG